MTWNTSSNSKGEKKEGSKPNKKSSYKYNLDICNLEDLPL